MISTLVPASTPKLSVSANNWALINRALLAECLYKFGECGEQIRLQEPVPLKPYAKEPTRNDLDMHTVTGEPIPFQYTYQRRALSGDEEELLDAQDTARRKAIFLDNIPLSDRGSRDFGRASDKYAISVTIRAQHDSQLHQHLAADICSADSQTALASHRDYEAYLAAPAHARSLPYYLMLKSLHKIGDASSKHRRTAALISDAQEADSLEVWIERLNIGFEQFTSDFESETHPGYISLAEFKSFLFLKGTNRVTFRSVYDEQLRLSPSGRFDNPTQLMELFQQYANNHKMSLGPDPVSSQGSAYAAVSLPRPPAYKSPAAPAAAAAAQTRPARANSVYCSNCFSLTGIKRYGHLVDICNTTKGKALVAGASATAPPIPPLARDERLDQLEASIGSIAAFLTSMQSKDA
jgi:hypothetical protein